MIIGIAGGSGSGKTLFIEQLLKSVKKDEVAMLSMDNYYKPLNQQPVDKNGVENFDLPESIDKDRFLDDLIRLKKGESFSIPKYTYNNQNLSPDLIHIKASPVLVIEGIFTFHFKEIRDHLDLKVYIEAPDYLMLTRRITRDAKERGYDLNDVLYRFQHHVIPSYDKYIIPLKSESDIIIPNHTDFSVAVKLLGNYIDHHLR